jgi:hypothetical protein
MPNQNLDERRYVTTGNVDSGDTYKFGQLSETAKDVFIKEMTDFFNYRSTDSRSKLAEVKTIQKFGLGNVQPNERSLETLINLIIGYGDTLDRFPMIAITSTNMREKRMGLGDNFVDHVQYPASIIGTTLGPFNFTPVSDPYVLYIRTWPNGDSTTSYDSAISFPSMIFADITNVTIDQLITAINNSQALYYEFGKTNAGYLRISAGGKLGRPWPNYIEVLSTSSPEILSILGLTVGQSDTYLNTSNPVRARYVSAADMTINIDVVSDSITTRTEVADLVYTFFTFWMEKRRFQFLGRSYHDREINPEEWWHIGLKGEFSWSTEVVTPRAGVEHYDNIYSIRGSVPIFIEDFSDRKVVTEPRFLLRENIIPTSDFPSGDYYSR